MRQRAHARAAYCRALSGGKTEPQLLNSGEFWQQAWMEGVGACLWHGLNVEHDVLPASVFQTSIELPLRTQTAHVLMLRKINVSILKHMRESGIACITLRGQAIAEKLYHPSVSRPQTDIDLLISENDVPAAIALITQSGFDPVERHPLLFSRNSVLLDLHTDPLGAERIHAWAHLTPLRARDFFLYVDKNRLDGVPALTPHPRVNLPYLCFHAMKHSFERLIWLWDIALLAEKIQERHQWKTVLEGIREYHLERPCFYALSYVRVHLGASVPEEMLESIRPWMNRRERNMCIRFMHHEVIPFLAERLFARMMPDFRHRIFFWKETIFPRQEIRAQIAGEGCIRCGFIRKRLKQLSKAFRMLVKETWALLRLRS